MSSDEERKARAKEIRGWIAPLAILAVVGSVYFYAWYSDPIRTVWRAADAGDADALLRRALDLEFKRSARSLAVSQLMDLHEGDAAALHALEAPFKDARDRATLETDKRPYEDAITRLNAGLILQVSNELLERARPIIARAASSRSDEAAPQRVDFILHVERNPDADRRAGGSLASSLVLHNTGVSAAAPAPQLRGLAAEEIAQAVGSVERLGVVYEDYEVVGYYEGDCNPNARNEARRRYARIYVIDLAAGRLESVMRVQGSDPPSSLYGSRPINSHYGGAACSATGSAPPFGELLALTGGDKS